MKIANIYSRIPEELKKEFIEEILAGGSFRLERIVSHGHATARDEWFDQVQDEWVILLKGSAGIRIEGVKETKSLKPGDHIKIPAHCKHRVEWTDQNTETVWLALHY